jgi:hypothetical protein
MQDGMGKVSYSFERELLSVEDKRSLPCPAETIIELPHIPYLCHAYSSGNSLAYVPRVPYGRYKDQAHMIIRKHHGRCTGSSTAHTVEDVVR